MNHTIIKPCVLILNHCDHHCLQSYVQDASNLCEHLFLADFNNTLKVSLDVFTLDIIAAKQTKQVLLDTISQAKSQGCTHLITVDVKADTKAQELKLFLQAIKEHQQGIFVGVRSFKGAPILTKIERNLSTFWLRVQTSIKLQDIHHNFKAYPIELFNFIKLKETNYALDQEILVKAAWAGFEIREIPLSVDIVNKPKISFANYLSMMSLNTRFTMRALVPLPFRRYDRANQKAISLRHPIKALRQLMDDPYNRATPWQLARTAGISMAILTVPAPIIQSIFLLLSIGWLRLNRLCAIAMIPLTWPPFLPGLAILVGYRVKHGEWLTEFSIQTLGYEVGERALEWVIGSLVLTPILGITLGLVVGLAALAVSKKD